MTQVVSHKKKKRERGWGRKKEEEKGNQKETLPEIN
jgi:hypothetical protein